MCLVSMETNVSCLLGINGSNRWRGCQIEVVTSFYLDVVVSYHEGIILIFHILFIRWKGILIGLTDALNYLSYVHVSERFIGLRFQCMLNVCWTATTKIPHMLHGFDSSDITFKRNRNKTVSWYSVPTTYLKIVPWRCIISNEKVGGGGNLFRYGVVYVAITLLADTLSFIT